mmetsp:Transcript_28742/g.48275  ORF Transcript_28742/g.48275 Transcript_28742/m.48275 type:complete len:312 (-) Transcript_28742:154-1089(-)
MLTTKACSRCPSVTSSARPTTAGRIRPVITNNVNGARHRAIQICLAATTVDAPVKTKRAVVVLPGLGNATGDYNDFVQELEERDISATVAEVKRIDWLRNAAGLLDINYWKGTLKPRPTVDWYLDRITAAVEQAKEKSGDAQVCLLAHSAGGWMARVWMLENGVDSIDTIITLGSPLQPPPPGVVDQTRGILTYVAEASPGAFHPEVKYVCLNGKFIEGRALGDGAASLGSRLTGLGYKQVYGSAEVWGDGITPVPIGMLEGATCVELEGVYHSPLGAGEGRPWYGTPEILDQWVNFIKVPAIEEEVIASS